MPMIRSNPASLQPLNIPNLLQQHHSVPSELFRHLSGVSNTPDKHDPLMPSHISQPDMGVSNNLSPLKSNAHHADNSASDTTQRDQLLLEVTNAVEMSLEGDSVRTMELSSPAVDVIRKLERRLSQSSAGDGAGLTVEQRSEALLRAFGAIAQESLSERAIRQGKNIGLSTLRTGLIVGVTTTLRQAAGFITQQALNPNQAIAVHTGMSMLAPALNIIGLVRDEYRLTATATSRAARVQMLGAAAIATATTYLSGTQAVIPAFLVQVATYTMTRDFLQTFLPLRANTSDFYPTAITVAQSAYGLNQFAVDQAMAYAAPNSGAGAASVPGAQMNWGDSAKRGAINAFGEVVDEQILLNTNRQMENNHYQKSLIDQSPELISQLGRVLSKAEQDGLENGMSGPALNDFVTTAIIEEVKRNTEGLRLWTELRIPTIQQCIDQVCTTNAMRTSAFNVAYAAAIAADALIDKRFSPQAISVLSSMFIGGVLAFIYAPMLNAGAQQPPPSADLAPQPARKSSLRKRSNDFTETVVFNV